MLIGEFNFKYWAFVIILGNNFGTIKFLSKAFLAVICALIQYCVVLSEYEKPSDSAILVLQTLGFKSFKIKRLSSYYT